MSELTREGKSNLAREHVFTQMDAMGMLDGLGATGKAEFDADSLGEIAELSLARGMLPVVSFKPFADAMRAYENAEKIQTMFS